MSKNKHDLRKVEFPDNLTNIIPCGGKGYFHRWFKEGKEIIGLIEVEDGTLKKIPARNIQFADFFQGEKKMYL
ncbi:hypothetical protein [Aureibaculum luteum]|uniref:hypothetical protein n=1 Tax=Aureibaculum luteum TaxID=1548456 RepID=UPI000E54684B|nr:hypothetical protein [Aureibaculum luteum]